MAFSRAFWKTGRLLPNKQRFPDMAALAAYLHSKGLKLGLSSSATSHTCSGYAGSQGHELEDAALFAGWGIDYLRYGWCPLTIDKQKPPPDMIGAFVTMRQGLDEENRNIVYSVSTYARNASWKWATPIAGANSWGTTPAMYDAWSVLSANGFRHPDLAPYAMPGHWNNPGWLMAGRTGFGSLHFSHLTLPEQMAQLSLWSLQAAPLILSCDLSQLDPNAFHRITTALLGLPQAAVKSGLVRFLMERWPWDCSIWQEAPRLSPCPGRLWGCPAPQPVRDLWLRRELGSATDTLIAQVLAPGVAWVRIGAPGPLKLPPAPVSEPERGD